MQREVFPDDPWRIEDTYNTAIGQYGFQITPIQAVRAVSSIANEGKLLTPSIVKEGSDRDPLILDINKEYFQVVKEGMRYSVTHGTAVGLQIPGLKIAAKTGTAEVGNNKESVHSWVTGFFPYDTPRYAFVVVMEQAPRGTLVGSVKVARDILEWIMQNKPEYTF